MESPAQTLQSRLSQLISAKYGGEGNVPSNNPGPSGPAAAEAPSEIAPGQQQPGQQPSTLTEQPGSAAETIDLTGDDDDQPRASEFWAAQAAAGGLQAAAQQQAAGVLSRDQVASIVLQCPAAAYQPLQQLRDVPSASQLAAIHEAVLAAQAGPAAVAAAAPLPGVMRGIPLDPGAPTPMQQLLLDQHMQQHAPQAAAPPPGAHAVDPAWQAARDASLLGVQCWAADPNNHVLSAATLLQQQQQQAQLAQQAQQQALQTLIQQQAQQQAQPQAQGPADLVLQVRGAWPPGRQARCGMLPAALTHAACPPPPSPPRRPLASCRRRWHPPARRPG